MSYIILMTQQIYAQLKKESPPHDYAADPFPSLFGIRVQILPPKYARQQTRWPASRCKRIRRKFAKKYWRMVEVETDRCYRMQDPYADLFPPKLDLGVPNIFDEQESRKWRATWY
jgi:hypothetical protein